MNLCGAPISVFARLDRPVDSMAMQFGTSLAPAPTAARGASRPASDRRRAPRDPGTRSSSAQHARVVRRRGEARGRGVPAHDERASTLEGYVLDVDATIVRACSTRAAPSWARCTASTSASRAAATRALPVPCRIRASPVTRQATRPPEARPSWRRRGRDGHRRRPGWLDPHPGCLLWRVRIEAHARPRPLHRRLPHRDDARSHGPHDGDGGRQRAAARGAGRARRPRSAPGERQDRRLHERADGRRARHEDRRREGRLRPRELGGRRRRARAQGLCDVQAARRARGRGVDPAPPGPAPPSGHRSPSRARRTRC